MAQPHRGPSRMVVQDCTGHQISVRVAAMQSLAVVPFGVPPPEPAVETSMLERFRLQRLQEPNKLDNWLPLPGMGGNFIQMRPRGPGVESSGLLMYSALSNYQVLFRSTWNNGDIILMQHGDVLKVCPAQHVWPWCSYCARFLLPAESHRLSKKHQRMLEKLRAGDPATVLMYGLSNMERYGYWSP